MGWNSWCTDSLCNLFGKDPCSETLVKETVDSIVANGLDKLGYNYVALDDCWSDTKRDENGQTMSIQRGCILVCIHPWEMKRARGSALDR